MRRTTAGVFAGAAVAGTATATGAAFDVDGYLLDLFLLTFGFGLTRLACAFFDLLGAFWFLKRFACTPAFFAGDLFGTLADVTGNVRRAEAVSAFAVIFAVHVRQLMVRCVKLGAQLGYFGIGDGTVLGMLMVSVFGVDQVTAYFDRQCLDRRGVERYVLQ